MRALIRVKRVYDAYEEEDGIRILVDRLWPRGLRKEEARIDYWMKDIAPSSELRKWFSHDKNKWEEFKRKYFEELRNKGEKISFIKELSKTSNVTLLYSSKERIYNNAMALKEYLDSIE